MPRRYPSLRTFRAIYISSERGTLSNDDECCICLDRYDNGAHRPVGVTSNRECEHVFGRRCLEAYLDSTHPSKNTCPVCRRKWYSQRSINPPTPRDTNTSQVLSSPTRSGASVRGGARLRALHRHTSRANAQAVSNTGVDQAVEQLVNNMEALEALERMGTVRLEQDVRVRLQQVQGRIRAFLERTVETSEVSFGPVLHRRSRIVPYIVGERPISHRPDPVAAELDNGQNSLSGVAFRGSTVSLPELPLPGQRSSLQVDSSPMLAPAAPDYRRNLAAVERRSIYDDRATGGHLLVPGSRTEAALQVYGRRNVALPQPSSQSMSRQAVDARAIRDHLRAQQRERSGNRSVQHTSLHDIAEPEGSRLPPAPARAASIQAIDRNSNHQQNRPPVYSSAHATDHAPILFPRYQIPHLRRTLSTHGFGYDSQSAGTPLQPILASSMADRGAGLRSRATATRSPRRLSRIMSISSLRNLVGRNREE